MSFTRVSNSMRSFQRGYKICQLTGLLIFSETFDSLLIHVSLLMDTNRCVQTIATVSVNLRFDFRRCMPVLGFGSWQTILGPCDASFSFLRPIQSTRGEFAKNFAGYHPIMSLFKLLRKLGFRVQNLTARLRSVELIASLKVKRLIYAVNDLQTIPEVLTQRRKHSRCHFRSQH